MIRIIFDTEENDFMSFWALKLAFSSSEEEYNWHLKSEQALLLVLQSESKRPIFNKRLTLLRADDVNFGESQDIYLLYRSIHPNAQCTQIEDFQTLTEAIPTFNFTIIQGHFMIETPALQLQTLKLAQFA